MARRAGCCTLQSSRRNRRHTWPGWKRTPTSCSITTAIEYLWANLKDLELANLPTTTLAEVADATEQGIQRVCRATAWWLGSWPTPA
jgi:hypothetical protein